MSGFYESIAEYYDWIFQQDPEAVEFVRRFVPSQCCGLNVLDVGCGTGTLGMALSVYGMQVIGIDLDADMVRLAKEKSEGNGLVRFEILDMLAISQRFGNAEFDAVLCLGNTLVHLDGMGEITDFVRQVRSVLKSGGGFLVQVLNYDSILAHKRDALPVIDNQAVRFERRYAYPEGSPHVLFQSVLTVKDTGRKIENEVKLYPVRKRELDGAFAAAGFRSVGYFGDFRGWPPEEGKLPLIAAAA
jgi:SAM-dependent methyltransferase